MSGRSITADGKLSRNITIYNSVLLDSTGIIHQVKTTFPTGESALPSEWEDTGVYVTAYSFSPFPADLFTHALAPHHFEEDDLEPQGVFHLKLQEVILTGSGFVNQFRADGYDHRRSAVVRSLPLWHDSMKYQNPGVYLLCYGDRYSAKQAFNRAFLHSGNRFSPDAFRLLLLIDICGSFNRLKYAYSN